MIVAIFDDPGRCLGILIIANKDSIIFDKNFPLPRDFDLTAFEGNPNRFIADITILMKGDQTGLCGSIEVLDIDPDGMEEPHHIRTDGSARSIPHLVLRKSNSVS